MNISIEFGIMFTINRLPYTIYWLPVLHEYLYPNPMEKRDQMLYDKLKEYAAGGVYPMHMPGHKRNMELLPLGLPYDIDITEIHGFDDLHDAHGILREISELASGLYGSDRAFLLVNGSTVGILAAIGAHTERGDRILATSNCHRSVRNAAALFGLDPVYLTPETDETSGIACSISPEAVDLALKKMPDIKLVVVTSPTYEGVISDIGSIADIVHGRNIPLFVDSAHGAHLGFSPGFPGSAVRAGADIVVMSLHKTLPALTQCSLLHICGAWANAGETARLLSVLQTSSPSYVLLASIDRCLRLLEADGDKLFYGYERNLSRFSNDIMTLKNLSVLCHGSPLTCPDFFAFDPGKLVIVTKNTALSGFMLADILRTEYKIELELANNDFALAMTGICDSTEGFTRLAEALTAIDNASD